MYKPIIGEECKKGRIHLGYYKNPWGFYFSIGKKKWLRISFN